MGDVSREKISKCFHFACCDFEIKRLTLASHCPWVDNCVGVNNHKHFLLYVIFLIIGIALLIQLTIACMYFPNRLQDALG